MTTAEKMLVLIRAQFADDCELDTYTERHNNRVREQHEKARANGVWDEEELQRTAEEWTQEFARHQQLADKRMGEVARLRKVTSPSELTPEQHAEILGHLNAMRDMAVRRMKESQEAAEQANRWLEGGPPPPIF